MKHKTEEERFRLTHARVEKMADEKQKNCKQKNKQNNLPPRLPRLVWSSLSRAVSCSSHQSTTITQNTLTKHNHTHYYYYYQEKLERDKQQQTHQYKNKTPFLCRRDCSLFTTHTHTHNKNHFHHHLIINNIKTNDYQQKKWKTLLLKLNYYA